MKEDGKEINMLNSQNITEIETVLKMWELSILIFFTWNWHLEHIKVNYFKFNIRISLKYTKLSNTFHNTPITNIKLIIFYTKLKKITKKNMN